jgi:hypothetical protein
LKHFVLEGVQLRTSLVSNRWCQLEKFVGYSYGLQKFSNQLHSLPLALPNHPVNKKIAPSRCVNQSKKSVSFRCGYFMGIRARAKLHPWWY